MIVAGILCGLTASFFQSVCYVLSRRFVTGRGRSAGLLFALTHIEMGVVAVAALPILLAMGAPPLSQFYRPLIGAAFFYLTAQAGLFWTLRHIEASRVSPLLGLKILIIAIITVAFLDKTVTGLQWLAVVLCVAAAFILNYSGGGLPLPAIVGVLLCCVGYSLSDLNIRFLVDSMGDGIPRWRAIVLSCCCCYVLTGIVGLALRAKYRLPPARVWRAAAPSAASWLAAMVMLFATFATIGVVFGNIVQSSRGLISILLGALIARAGHAGLERKVGPGVLWRRAVAALLMSGAVALYVLGRG